MQFTTQPPAERLPLFLTTPSINFMIYFTHITDIAQAVAISSRSISVYF